MAEYRYWCGECGYRTPWHSQSRGAGRRAVHYAARHPAVLPGGRVEVRTNSGGGGGCLLIVGILFVLLLIASTCRTPDFPHSLAGFTLGVMESP